MSCLKDWKPIAAIVAVQVIYASVVILLKLSLNEGVNPMVFVLYRHIVASISLAPVAYMIHRRSKKVGSVGKKAFFLVFLAALIRVTIYQNLYLTALQLGSSSLTTAMSNVTPAVTFLMAAMMGMEKVDMRSIRSLAKVIGTAICIGGAMLMAFFKGEKLLSHVLVGEKWLMACLSLLGCTTSYSVWLILQVPLCDAFPEPIILSFWTCLFAAFQCLVLALFQERDFSAWRFSSNLEIFSCIYTGIAGSAMTYWFNAWAVSKKGPVFSALFNPLCTVITTLLSFVITHEDLYFGSLVGAVVVVVGLYVVLWGKAADPIKGNRSRDERTDVEGAMRVEADVEEPLINGNARGIK